jgi:hypothetical protein
MRHPKIFLAISGALFILIVLGMVSFFTATNRVSLTAKEAAPAEESAFATGSAITTEPTGIQCNLANYSIRPVYYGARFSVEKWVEDRWEEVPAPEDLRFTLGILVVKPFSSTELFYPASLFTETTGGGAYRIVQDVWMGDSRTAKRHELYCEFTAG